MAAAKSKQRKSLCEESMILILNILKLSSLSLARNTLPSAASSSAGDPSPAPKRLASAVGRSSSRRKAQRAPEGGTKLSYVMVPTGSAEVGSTAVVIHHQKTKKKGDSGNGRFADYIRRFHEKTENEVQNAVVECKASDYIKRFHDKIKKDVNNDSKRLVLPPRLHPQNYP